MIDKKDYKLLMDITRNKKLYHNNFKSISDIKLNQDKNYYVSLENFLSNLKTSNLKIDKNRKIKEGFTNFSDYNLSKEYIEQIDKHLNPMIENFDDKYLQKKKEYIYYKDVYGEMLNVLDNRIKFYNLILSDDRVIEPFIKSVGRAVSGAAKSVAKGVSNVANKAADAARKAAEAAAEAARKAAEAARKAAEFLKRKIEEAVNKVKDQANKIKAQIASKFAFLTKTLEKIKEIGRMIIKIKDQIINTARDAINKVKNIQGQIPRLIANLTKNSTNKAKRNYKLAGEIKKAAILEARRELQNGIKLARRIAASQPKKPKEKEYQPDTSDFKSNASEANSDLNSIKKSLTVNLPERKYDLSPFYLILFVCFILFLIKEIYL